MASASFVEIISHFAGYLQIFHDIARDRPHYDETIAPDRFGDYTTPRPYYDHRFSPDDLVTKGGFVPELIAEDLMDVFRGRLPKLSRESLSPDTDSFPPALNPKLPVPTAGGGGDHFYPEVIDPRPARCCPTARRNRTVVRTCAP